MTTENAVDAAIQIKRLLALGYAVTDVTPPLAETAMAPPDNRPL